MEENKRENTFGQRAQENMTPSIEDLLRDVESEASIPTMDSKELERQINRRITAIVTRVLVILAVCVALLLCIIHPVMKLVTYNYKAKANTMNEETGMNELHRYLNAYTSVFMPFLEVYDVEVKDRGFGRYTMDLYIADHRDPIILSTEDSLDRFQVFGSKWESMETSNVRFVHVAGRFSEDLQKTPEEIVPELQQLPDSAVIFCAVTLPEPVLPEELWQEGIQICWFRVHQLVNNLDAGIRIKKMSQMVTDDQSGKWRERSTMTGAELKEEFLAELDILLSDEALLEPLYVPQSDRDENGRVKSNSLVSSGYESELSMLWELCQAAEQWDTIRTREVFLSGKKADVLAYIDAMNIEGVYVDDVWMSQWSK